MRKQSGRKQSPVMTFAVGARVFLPGGKRGTVKGAPDMNHATVEVDGDGGTFKYRLGDLALIPAE